MRSTSQVYAILLEKHCMECFELADASLKVFKNEVIMLLAKHYAADLVRQHIGLEDIDFKMLRQYFRD